MKEEPTGIDSQINEIEDELVRTKYNKATQFHVGKLKAKLAKLKEQQDKISGGGAHGYGYGLKKTGDSTALMIGFPSVGKSTLLNALTNADSKIGAYDFTTIDVVPGMLLYNSARIQILDLPGLIEGASSGMGRGKEVLSVARIADLVLLTTSAQKAEKEIEIMRDELYKANFRLDMKPSEIKIFKKAFGGISVGSTIKLKRIDTKTIQEVLKEFGVINADIIIREDCDIDRLIDGLRTNRVYVKSQVVITKADTVGEERKEELKRKFPASIIVSSVDKTGIEDLKRIIWDKSGLIRVYLKRIGKEPDMKEPLIMRKGDTISDVMRNVHRKMVAFFKYARVWGDSTKFPGQKLGLEHRLSDKDIVELHF